jgi:hypothetical protein
MAYIPRGTVHAWRPTGRGPVRQLLIAILVGFEGYSVSNRRLVAAGSPETDPFLLSEYSLIIRANRGRLR